MSSDGGNNMARPIRRTPEFSGDDVKRLLEYMKRSPNEKEKKIAEEVKKFGTNLLKL